MKKLLLRLKIIFLLVFAFIFVFNFNCYAQTAEINPNKGDEYFKLGLRSAANHMYDQAIMYFKKSIELDPSNSLSYMPMLLNAYLAQKDYDQALTYSNKIIELRPNEYTDYGTRGYIHLQKRDFDKAIVDYTKTLAIIDNLTSDDLEKMRSFLSVQEYKKILEKYQGAIYFQRAEAFLGKGDYEKSWDDEHKAELFGVKIDPKFIEDLKRVSGKDK